MTDDDIIKDVLRREGGYVNRPEDRGGPTNFGVTLATLRQARGKAKLTAEDVKALTLGEAIDIYRRLYLQPFSGVESVWLRAQLFDYAVQHGTRTAILALQRAVGVNDDGVIGPRTLAAVNAAPWRKVAGLLIEARLAIYGSLLRRHPVQAIFAPGWMRRMGEMVRLATQEA